MSTHAIAGVFAVGLACTAHAQIVSLGTFHGHQYLYDRGGYVSVDQARLAAQAAGAQLVSITSAAENDFLISAITPIANESLRLAWIGLSRPTPSVPFVWDSGEALAYDHWRPAGVGESWPEPTGETDSVFYVKLSGTLGPVPIGYWADVFHSSAEPFNAIYEIAVPGPSGAALAAVGLVVGCGRRRRA